MPFYDIMKVLVFGAATPTGKLVIQEALEKGHDVTAFTSSPLDLMTGRGRFKVVQGDILNPLAVERAMEGHEGVVVSLEPTSETTRALQGEGTKNVIAAMRKYGIRRIVVLSSSGVLATDSGSRFGHLIMPHRMKENHAEEETQVDEVRNSGLNWIVVRSSRLVDGPKTGKWEVTFDRPAKSSISRADVAAFMVNELEETKYLHEFPIISR